MDNRQLTTCSTLPSLVSQQRTRKYVSTWNLVNTNVCLNISICLYNLNPKSVIDVCRTKKTEENFQKLNTKPRNITRFILFQIWMASMVKWVIQDSMKNICAIHNFCKHSPKMLQLEYTTFLMLSMTTPILTHKYPPSVLSYQFKHTCQLLIIAEKYLKDIYFKELIPLSTKWEVHTRHTPQSCISRVFNITRNDAKVTLQTKKCQQNWKPQIQTLTWNSPVLLLH